MWRIKLVHSLVIASAIMLWNSSASAKQLFTEAQYHMGTRFSLTIAEPKVSHFKLKKISRLVFKEIIRIDQKYSTYKDSSVLSQLNKTAQTSAVAIDKETYDLIEFAFLMNTQSFQAFDITSEGLSRIWNFSANPFSLPDNMDLKHYLARMGQNNIILESDSVLLNQTTINFNAFAKGYAVDRAVEILHSNGIHNFIIDGGGDMYVSGTRWGQFWKVGIQAPQGDRNEIIGRLFSKNRGEAIVTSGNYNNFVYHNGKRYSHILDPRTGYPAQGNQSVTVVSKEAMVADALATAFMVLDIHDIKHILDQHADIECLVILNDGSRLGTKRFLAIEGVSSFTQSKLVTGAADIQ